MLISEVSSALSEPVRLEILRMIADGRGLECCSPANPNVPEGVCSCDILSHFPDMGQSKLAYHMKILRKADLVRDTKRGKWVYYTLNEQRFRSYMDEISHRYLEGLPVT